MVLTSLLNSNPDHQAPTEEPAYTAWDFTRLTNVFSFYQLSRNGDQNSSTPTQDKRYGLMYTSGNGSSGPIVGPFEDRENHIAEYTEENILNHSSSTKATFHMYSLGPGQEVQRRVFSGGEEVSPPQEQA